VTGTRRGEPVALVVPPDHGVVAVTPAASRAGLSVDEVRRIEDDVRPRWVWWSAAATADVLAAVPVARAFDLAAVHRLLHGGWRADPGVVWARANGLDPETAPAARQPDLFDPGPSPAELAEPVGPDGHLRPEWPAGEWSASAARATRWGALALDVAATQRRALDELAATHPQAVATAHVESAAEVLCVELGRDGLPLDRAEAERIIAGIVGARPRSGEEAAAQRKARDAEVLRHDPAGARTDLRNPAQVRSLLRRVGVEVPDTRAWRLEQVRDVHPLVEALLAWRRIERTATTYGYGWLDEHVGPDGRLHGQWTGSDGAAGRMTATAGLHNLPADLRPSIVAEPGYVLVRADLGQIEPRVLAAVSGDAALARATTTDDLYAPVAAQLGVDRPTAKVAVLGAMYGQTTGHGAQALRRLEAAYPVAMAYLHEADVAGQVGRDVRTYGGRLIRTWTTNANEVSERDARSRAAAIGRYARNAMVQGAAAELFKRWAVTVRARLGAGGQIVLCLHDELLVHVPAADGADAARLVDDCLQEAARSWAPDDAVRFIADTAVVHRWSDAKT
jgi:DNA polymerase family A